MSQLKRQTGRFEEKSSGGEAYKCYIDIIDRGTELPAGALRF